MSYFSSSYIDTINLVTSETYEPLAQNIAHQLQEQGISVEVSALSDAGVQDCLSKRNFQLLLTTINGVDGTADFADSERTVTIHERGRASAVHTSRACNHAGSL